MKKLVIVLLLIGLTSLNGCYLYRKLFGDHRSFIEICQNPYEDQLPILQKLTEYELPKHQYPLDSNPDRQFCEALYQGVKKAKYIVLGEKEAADLSVIREFDQIEKLEIHWPKKLQNFSPLSRLTSLKDLMIKSEFVDLSFLSDLPQLERLYLDSTTTYNLEAISRITSLKRLAISYEKLADLSFVSSLKNLESLSITRKELLRDISPLAGLTKLRYLYLSQCSVTDICPLKNLINLEIVNLNYNQVEKTCSLHKLKKLRRLGLFKNKLNDLNDFSGLKSLEFLDIRSNQITDISAIKESTELNNIIFAHNQIENIDVLANFKSLKYAILDNNKIKNMNAVQNLTKLKRIWLSANQIESVPLLSRLKELEYLGLDTNKIKDVNGIRGLDKLKVFTIRGNPIEDFTPVVQYMKEDPVKTKEMEKRCTLVGVLNKECTQEELRITQARKWLRKKEVLENK